jgi:tetratricopeptide (TPR) repeat protein/energy-coupling factor transporter ATP-binding protein EcfA2
MSQQPVLSHEAPIYGSRNLPVHPAERLFGRDADLDTIHLALKAGTAVLLHGPAGIGKSALAAALASGYAELPGGVLWLEVIDDTVPLLLGRAARAYGADLPSGGPDLSASIAQVRGVLQENRPLVVVDGRVDVDAAREFVRGCASGIPLLLVHSKLVAGPWTPHAVAPLGPDDASAMLMQVAGTSLDADTVDLARLVEALDGHALSIVLAAHQLAAGGVQPAQFLDQIPELPPGVVNRAMGAITAAYRLLPSELQGMVMLLGTAFAGEASEELLSDITGAPADAIRSRMQQLAARGFASERSVYGQSCFAVHELVQMFAESFLRGKQRLDTMRARYLDGLLAYVRRHTAEANSSHYQRLAAEMPTILAAGKYAAENEKVDFLNGLIDLLRPAAPESFVTACAYQVEFRWLQRLLEPTEAPVETGVPTEEAGEAETAWKPAPRQFGIVEGIQEQDTMPAQAVAGLEEVEKAAPLHTMPESVRPPAPALELPTDAEALERLGRQAAEAGATSESIDRYAQALEGYKADGNVEDELAALEALAVLSLESEKYSDVLSYIDRGMALAHEADNPRREGELLTLLGDLQASLGRVDGAETAYKEAINAFRPTEAWLNIGLTLNKLAFLYWEEQRHDDALAMWEQTIPIFEREQRTDLLRDVLDRLGDTQAELMRWDNARANYTKALELTQSAGDKVAAFEELSRLGMLQESSGDREGAQLYFRRALHLAFELDDKEELGFTLLALARMLVDDTAYLNRSLQLLQAASELLPDDSEVKRLLNRAKTRQERLLRAGITLPLAEESLQEFARAAAEPDSGGA